MPKTLRETIPQHGSFVRKLYDLHENPTFETLMEAYTVADMTNRTAIERALRETHILERYDVGAGRYTGEYLDLDEVHQVWLKMRFGGDLVLPLESQFPLLTHLDDPVPTAEDY